MVFSKGTQLFYYQIGLWAPHSGLDGVFLGKLAAFLQEPLQNLIQKARKLLFYKGQRSTKSLL